MGGKASVIFVIGFATIFALIAFRMREVESRAVDNMSNYIEITNSHNVALAGIQVGLGRLAHETKLREKLEEAMNEPGQLSEVTLAEDKFESGPYAGAYYKVTVRGLDAGDSRLRLQAVSEYPIFRLGGAEMLKDTVVIELDRLKIDDFKILGLMLGFGGADDTWVTGDKMTGRIHFNGRLTVSGSPIFNSKVTVSKGFSPPVGIGTNKAILLDGYEEGVKQIALPAATDLYNDLEQCKDHEISTPMSLEFMAGDPTVNGDGVILARSGLHMFGRGVFRTTNTGSVWRQIDGAGSLTDGNVVALTFRTVSGTDYLFAGTQNNGAFRSTNLGVTWEKVNTGLTNLNVRAFLTTASEVYAGTGGGVFRSTNWGTSWTAVNTGLLNTDVSCLAFKAVSGVDYLFAGTMGGGVFVSTNSGSSWTSVSAGLGTLDVRSLAVATTTNDRIYAGTRGFGVYEAPISLAPAWLSMNTGLTNLTVLSLTHTRTTSPSKDYLIAGTPSGIFRMIDFGGNWSAQNSGLGSLNIRSSHAVGSDVIVGTAEGMYLGSAAPSSISWNAKNESLKNRNIRAVFMRSANQWFAGTYSDTLMINDETAFPNGVIYSTADLSVRGRVDTRDRGPKTYGVSIGTSAQIYLAGDILYERDPRDTTSDDMLGLVALNDIVVYNDAGNTPNDYLSKTAWTIHAIMCSLEGTMKATVGSSPTPSFTGILSTLGGIITKNQFRIAKYSGAGLTNGFNRDFHWDPRLGEDIKPPCFPAPDNPDALSQFTVSNWWENVRVPRF
jgi:hypothetical protein